MSSIEKSVTVDVPVRVAYDQWTQLESFPQFMSGVESVTQRDDKRVHWKVRLGGVTREWDAEIVEQRRDRLIRWRAVDGTENAGTVSFEAPNFSSTRVTVRLDLRPEGILERVGDVLGVAERTVGEDLVRFKHFIESRGVETGQWRGEIDESGEVRPDEPNPLGP